MNEQDMQRLAEAQAGQPSIGDMIPAIVIGSIFGLLMIVSLWKVFAKAGEPGWAAIVPIYNVVVLVKISGKPLWWLVLFFIPCVNIIASFVVYVALAERFGKGTGFGIGLWLLGFIFLPILAFGDAQYTPART
jgi:hypothetical protein